MKKLRATPNTAIILLGVVLSALLLACEKPPQAKSPAPAQSRNEDSKILEQALTLDKKTGSNVLEGSEVVSRLSKSGVFVGDALLRKDYSSYYVPKKRVQLLGHSLVYFDHEYMGEYVGCCVNSGNAVVLLAESDTTQVEDFAKMNKCRVEKGDQIYINDDLLKLLNIGAEKIPLLVEVSCKERNRND